MSVKVFFFITFFSFTTTAYCQGESKPMILNSRQTNTIEQLLAPYKGHPVFIDLWASWCAPCKEEFKFAPALYKELGKRNIKMLYISIDKDPADSVWKKDIQDFKLYGYHIKANKSLRDELTTFIWGGIDAFSIPNYLLFDKDGHILSKHMPRPENMQELCKEIDEKIRN